MSRCGVKLAQHAEFQVGRLIHSRGSLGNGSRHPIINVESDLVDSIRGESDSSHDKTDASHPKASEIALDGDEVFQLLVGISTIVDDVLVNVDEGAVRIGDC